MTRDELRAALAALDAEEAQLDREMEPLRQQMKPFHDRQGDIEDRREALLEANEAEVVGKCFNCTKILLVGDLGCHYGDEGPACADCAPTYGDVRDYWAEFKPEDDDDAEDRRLALARIDAHWAAGGSLDDPFVSEM